MNKYLAIAALILVANMGGAEERLVMIPERCLDMLIEKERSADVRDKAAVTIVGAPVALVYTFKTMVDRHRVTRECAEILKQGRQRTRDRRKLYEDALEKCKVQFPVVITKLGSPGRTKGYRACKRAAKKLR